MKTKSLQKDPAYMSDADKTAESKKFHYTSIWLIHRLVIIGILLNLFLFSVTGILINQSRIQYVRQNTVIVENIAQVLDANISGIIAKVDIAIQAVTDEANRELSHGSLDKKTFDAFIVREHSRIPELVAFRATDPFGMAIYGADSRPVKTRSLAHRDYFKYLRDNPQAGLVFSEPLVGGISGKWMILFARRFNGPDGSFGGLVYAGVSLEYLSQSFRTINIGEKGVISLRDQNLGLIVKHPSEEDIEKIIGSKNISVELKQLVNTGNQYGTYYTKGSPFLPIPHLSSYRKIGNYPFYIIMALAEQEYLAQWRKDALVTLIALFLFLIGTVIFCILYYENVLKRYRSSNLLAMQEEKYRTLADYTYDWEFWQNPDGKYVYVSPSCLRITGYEPELFYQDPLFIEKIIYSDDLPQFQAHLHHENAETKEIFFRIFHADGSLHWIDHVCQKIINRQGKFLGIRGTNRDVTERKLSEEKIKSLLEEKDLILREVHHRIKNNMAAVSSLLNIQSKNNTAASAAQVLQNASSRVKSMGILYEKLYQSDNIQRISIKKYLQSLLDEIIKSYQIDTVKIETKFDEVIISAKILSSVGIIINELVNNALKYAFTGRESGVITLTAHEEGTQAVITFSDNGSGLPDFNENQSSFGFGLKLVENLTRQIDGTLSISRTNGTTFIIEFPNK